MKSNPPAAGRPALPNNPPLDGLVEVVDIDAGETFEKTGGPEGDALPAPNKPPGDFGLLGSGEPKPPRVPKPPVVCFSFAPCPEYVFFESLGLSSPK